MIKFILFFQFWQNLAFGIFFHLNGKYRSVTFGKTLIRPTWTVAMNIFPETVEYLPGRDVLQICHKHLYVFLMSGAGKIVLGVYIKLENIANFRF